MGKLPVTATQWDAARRVSEGEPPTRVLVAAMLGVAVSNVQARSRKEGWQPINFRFRAVVDKFRDAAEFAQRLQAGDDPERDDETLPFAPEAVAEVSSRDDDAEPPADTADLDPLDMLARGSAFVSRQIARLIARAEKKGGRLDKAEIDGLVALSRMMERWESLARDRAQEQQTRSEAELADLLRSIDERIVELARDEAERLVREQDRAGSGDAAHARVAA